MNNRDRKNFLTADRLLLVLALAVFGGLLISRLGSPSLPRISEAGPDVLVFTQWWQREMEEGTLESIAGEFEALHPGVRIELHSLSYGEIRDGLTGRRGEAPGAGDLLARSDILGLDPLWLQDLLRDGRLAALEDPPGSDPAPEWAVPLVSFMTPLFYNIEVLRSAGFSRPPRNRGEFLELAGALAAQGRFAIALSLSPENPQGIYQDIFPWFWASGAVLVQGGKPVFTGPAVTGALGFFEGLHRDKLVSPGSFSKTVEQKREEFIAGRIGMMTGSIRDIAFLRERMKPAQPGTEAFGITALPGPDALAGKPVFGLSGWYAALSSGSKHPGTGRAFLAFLAERAPRLSAAAAAVPGSGNSPGGYITEDPLYSKAWDMYEGGEAARFENLPRFRDLEALFRVEFLGLCEGAQTPAETAAAIQRGWEKILLP